MFNVKNRKVINRLSFRSLKGSRLRNIMAVIAIMLTCILFTTLVTVGLGTIDAFQQASMRQAGGEGHAVLKDIDDDIYDKVKTHPSISRISYNLYLCDNVDNPELIKRRGEFWYKDKAGIEMSFATPKVGKLPQKSNEIITDTTTLMLMGIEPKVGEKLTLDLKENGKSVKREFVLSGYWDADPALNVSTFITSKAYVDKYKSQLNLNKRNPEVMTGKLMAYLDFNNEFNIESKLDKLIEESGYDNKDENAPNYINSNINWAYMSNSIGNDPLTTGILITLAIIVLITGYLIIYNIFQISVLKDIHFYGMLKTIGGTGRQIKGIVRKQALMLSIVGIPLGLALGFLIGSKLVPMVINVTTYSGTEVTVEANPFIFIGATIFTLITVYISTLKPGITAAKMSPIEATKFSDVGIKRKKEKVSTDGGKVWRMAFSNLGRNKKKTTLILISLSLGLVIFSVIATLSNSLDIEKFVSKFVVSDFSVKHTMPADKYYLGLDDTVPDDFIEMIEKRKGFKDGGRLYISEYEDSSIITEADESDMNMDERGNPISKIYGADDFVFKNSQIIEGELNLEKLKSGKYVLLGVYTDDYGKPEDSGKVNVGDKIKLKTTRGTGEVEDQITETSEYEVLGKIILNPINHDQSYSTDYVFFVPSENYLKLVDGNPLYMYSFNVDDNEISEAEKFIAGYTKGIDPNLTYSSKSKTIKEFDGMRNLVVSFGGVLSGIVALIGILNFANSIITSIITRRRESAMLEAIGMTRSQLSKMLILEGLYYAIGTMIITTIISMVLSLTALKSLLGVLWFTTYNLTVWPLLVCFPVLLLLAIIIPVLSNKTLIKDSVVERIRIDE